MAQLTLSLLSVLALIFFLGWLVKRLKLGRTRSRGDIAVIDELILGPRERILLLRVGDAQVLVGVGGVVGVSPVPSPIAIASSAPLPSFAERLRDFMKDSGYKR